MGITEKRERYRRFWEPLTKGEGGYLAVSSPIDDGGVSPFEPEPPASLEERWLDADYRVRRAEAGVNNTFRGLDAIQNEWINFGPGVHAAILGAPYTLQENSVWFDLEPPIKGWEPMPRFVTNRDHPLYKAVEAQTRALCTASQGRYAVSFTDIGGQLDVLFSLRGEELLSDMLEYPEQVLAAQEQLDREFLAYFHELSAIIASSGCGYTGWIPVLSDVPWYPVQCDLSVMISPALMEKYVMPSLHRISSAIGRAIYHLDGPGQIKHLDMLLTLKDVHAIQWVPLPTMRQEPHGRGVQNFADGMSLDVYRRVLSAGKKVVLLQVPPVQVPKIYEAVGADGVFIVTHCPTRAEAEALVGMARGKWVRG